jgi:hypothetical protein
MPTEYEVKAGDCISSIAFDYGMFPDTIWNDPANAALKQKRKNPNVLLPGDIVIIRDQEIKEYSRVTEKRHRFKRKGAPEMLKLVLEDEQKKPRANVKYLLTIDSVTHEGRTDGEGRISRPIPPNAQSGLLVVGEPTDDEEPQEFHLVLGDLDPVESVTGIQQRLRNLGYDPGPIDGEIGPLTREAIAKYQEQCGMEPGGELDDATRKRLEGDHLS